MRCPPELEWLGGRRLAPSAKPAGQELSGHVNYLHSENSASTRSYMTGPLPTGLVSQGETAMRVEIRFLHKADSLKQMLRSDGWDLRQHIATHPDVRDEQSARNRLSELGLLTSPSLRIAFQRGQEMK